MSKCIDCNFFSDDKFFISYKHNKRSWALFTMWKTRLQALQIVWNGMHYHRPMRLVTSTSLEVLTQAFSIINFYVYFQQKYFVLLSFHVVQAVSISAKLLSHSQQQLLKLILSCRGVLVPGRVLKLERANNLMYNILVSGLSSTDRETAAFGALSTNWQRSVSLRLWWWSVETSSCGWPAVCLRQCVCYLT